MSDSPELAAIRARDAASDPWIALDTYADRRALLRMLDEARKEYAEMVAKGADTILAAGRKVAEALKERDEARTAFDALNLLTRESADQLRQERDEARDALAKCQHDCEQLRAWANFPKVEG